MSEFTKTLIVDCGAEMVTNGGFESATGWTLGDNWSISNGRASRSASAPGSSLSQTVTFEQGKKYTIKYYVYAEAEAEGYFHIQGSFGNQDIASTEGEHTYTFTCQNTSNDSVHKFL